MIGDSSWYGGWRVCRRVGMVVVCMRKSPIDSREVFRRRPARVALPGYTLVAVTAARAAGQMSVVLLQQAADPQQITDADQIRPQLLHHRFRLGTGVEVELPAENRWKYVELLMGQVVRGAGRRGGRGGTQGPQAGRHSLEIQLDASLDRLLFCGHR